MRRLCFIFLKICETNVSDCKLFASRYYLIVRLWWRCTLFWELNLDRGNSGDRRWIFFCFFLLSLSLKLVCLQIHPETSLCKPWLLEGMEGGWQSCKAQTGITFLIEHRSCVSVFFFYSKEIFECEKPSLALPDVSLRNSLRCCMGGLT